MASSADIGSNFSDYAGSEKLGGGSWGVVNIDTKPLQQMKAYTMMYNKAEYDQRQKDAELHAAELAKFSQYDLSSAIPKDAKVIKEKFKELTDWMKENTEANDYNKDPDKFLEYQKKKGEFENLLTNAGARNAVYKGRSNAISATQDVNEKMRKQKALEQEIEATDISTPLKLEEQYELSFPEVTAKGKKFDVVQVGPNNIMIRDFEMFDAGAAKAQRYLVQTEIDEINLDLTSDEFKNKSPYEQNLLRNQAEAKKNILKKSGYGEMAKLVTDALSNEKYQTGGKLDIEKIRNDSSALGGTIKAIEKYNEYLRTKKEEIRTGIYKDRTGKAIQFDNSNLKESDYEEINWQDGLTGGEFAEVESFGKWKGDGRQTKVQETDDAIQYEGVKVAKRNAAVNEGQLALDRDKWTTASTGGETVKNGAWVRAESIFTDLQKLTNGTNIISPDQLRKMSVEQLKYLGIETPKAVDGNGEVTDPGGFKPLSLTANTAIELTSDGQIRVLENAKPIKDKRGNITSWEGNYNNTKSTNVRNVATNILNEELKTSGAKELNTYMAIDTGGGTTSNTSGGSTTQSASSTSIQKARGADGKIYTSSDGVTWVSEDGKNTVVQKKK